MKLLLHPPSLEDVLATFEFHRGRPYVTDDVLDFHIEIVKAQDRNRSAYREIDLYRLIEGENLEAKLASGFGLIDPMRISINADLSGALFDEICGICEKFGTLKAPQVERLINLRKGGRIDMVALVRNIIEQTSPYFEEMGEEIGLAPTILAFLAEHLAQPILARCAAEFDASLDVTGHAGRTTCPICSNEPLMAVLSDADEGRRYLHCSLCHARWEHSRTECPFCRNADHENLEYLFHEGDLAYRVYVCKLCKRYLKTIDERACGDRTPVLWVEALLTPFLDEVALERGYLRGAAPRNTE